MVESYCNLFSLISCLWKGKEGACEVRGSSGEVRSADLKCYVSGPVITHTSWNWCCWTQGICRTYIHGISTQVCTLLWSCQDPLLPFLLLTFGSRMCVCTQLAPPLCEKWLETNPNYNSLYASGTNFHTIEMYHRHQWRWGTGQVCVNDCCYDFVFILEESTSFLSAFKLPGNDTNHFFKSFFYSKRL